MANEIAHLVVEVFYDLNFKPFSLAISLACFVEVGYLCSVRHGAGLERR